MAQNTIDDKSTLVLVMAWCHQATSHYLSQCWPRSMSPYGVTRPHRVKAMHDLWNMYCLYFQENENEILKVCFMLKMARIIGMRYRLHKIHIVIWSLWNILCYLFIMNIKIPQWFSCGKTKCVIHHFISIMTHLVKLQSECDIFAICQYSDICSLWCLYIHWQVSCNDILNYMANLLWGFGLDESSIHAIMIKNVEKPYPSFSWWNINLVLFQHIKLFRKYIPNSVHEILI